jgi:hypothetical protein
MPTALLVTGSYDPAILADMQRARMLAWELPDLGWDVEILAPGPAETRPDALDERNRLFFAVGTPVHRVGSLCRWLFEWCGSRGPAWRTLWPMYREGARLLATGRFQVVYFTTTTFPYFALGPLWKRKFGVPYVLDFQDPWVKDADTRKREPATVKEKASETISHWLEKSAVTGADGLVSVSPRYIESLKRRYNATTCLWDRNGRTLVSPFAASRRDLDLVQTQRSAGREDALIRINYAGAGGEIMRRGFTLLCEAMALLARTNGDLVRRVRISLHGTLYGWRPGDMKLLEETACAHGLGEQVHEYPERVPYHRALELLEASDGALVLGVDTPGYTPSKLFSYALAGKPLLATVRSESPAFAWLQQAGAGVHALWFGSDRSMPVEAAAIVLENFLKESSNRQVFDRERLLTEQSPRAMAEKHAALFATCTALADAH